MTTISDDDFKKVMTTVALKKLDHVKNMLCIIQEALELGSPNPAVLCVGLHKAFDDLNEAYDYSFEQPDKEGDKK